MGSALLPLLLFLVSTPAAQAASEPAANRPPGTQATAQQLMRQGRCEMCHRWDRDWIGPSWGEIAREHQGASPQARSKLVQALRGGSTASHRSSIGMAPTDPAQLTEEQLRLIIDYIIDTGSTAPRQPQ